MKKYLFIALAAAGMLSSCSSDDAVVNGGVDSEDLVPIKIGMGSIVTNVTRGTGTVGIDNLWHSEKVNVYMFEQGTVKLAESNNAPIYDREVFTTPSGSASDWATAENGVKYYPAKGNFDFWGYRTDGAEDVTNIAIDQDAKTVTIPFTIHGDEDLMGAKGALLNGQVDLLTGDPTDPDVYTPANATRYYSAFSARKGVQPNLIFNHLLSRFAFQVKAGSNASDATYPVQITGIRVKSKATGNLIINATADAPEITWSNDAAVALSLKGVDTTTPFSLAGNSDYAPVADALLLAPGQAQYELEIDLQQDKPGLTQPWTDTYKTTITIPVITDTNDPNYVDPADPNYNPNPVAVKGNSYTVKIIVYGIEEIKVKTELSEWTMYPEPIDVDPDKEITPAP